MFCNLEQAQALLRLQRIMLTQKQRQSLRETVAIVGYSLRVREELPSSFLVAQTERPIAYSKEISS